MAKLVFLHGEGQGRTCELGDGTSTVGREDSNRIVLGDLTVSRKHCELQVYGPEVIVRDLGSTNGTTVEGKRLLGAQTQVLCGQVIQFGLVAARLELEPPRTERGATTALLEYREYVKSLADTHEIPIPSQIVIAPSGFSPKASGSRTSLLGWLNARPRPSLTTFTQRSPSPVVRSKWPLLPLCLAAAATLVIALTLWLLRRWFG